MSSCVIAFYLVFKIEICFLSFSMHTGQSGLRAGHCVVLLTKSYCGSCRMIKGAVILESAKMVPHYGLVYNRLQQVTTSTTLDTEDIIWYKHLNIQPNSVLCRISTDNYFVPPKRDSKLQRWHTSSTDEVSFIIRTSYSSGIWFKQ